MANKEKINPSGLLDCTSRAPFIFRYIWAKFHLLFLCGKCTEGTRAMRDLENRGECWWWENWKRKNYKIPFWMGRKEYRRLTKLRKEALARGEDFPHVGSLESVIVNRKERQKK